MTPPDIKKRYGEEYPAAIIVEGLRVPLHHETRFTRSYRSDELKTTYVQDRFLDGSASIIASELERDWATWTRDLQIDFCQHCCYLFAQADYRTMLRFIMQNGGPDHWCGIALWVAGEFPQQEAFNFLVQALQKVEIGRSSNITQGIAQTKHSSAETELRKHLGLIWEHPALWNDSTFLNWVASDATNCIAYLIEVGASPADFASQALRLSKHVCSCNRDSWNRRLSKHYPEISFQN
jgi:hypothetical protein